MKILFICSGHKNFDGEFHPGAVVQNQANSFRDAGLEIDFFLIKGKGITGYLKSVFPLVKKLKKNQYDALHSHYSLSAFVTTISLLFLGKKKFNHVVSLMGSDIQSKGWKRYLIKYFNKTKWKETIVKSEKMAQDIGLSKYHVIPNGVNLDIVKPKKDKQQPTLPMTVLFAANPNRKVKNYELAKSAMQKIDDTKAQLKVVYNKPHAEIINEINEADIVLLTSRWEGSPNIVKESMACNKPVVSTDVGDVRQLFGNEAGYFITSQEIHSIIEKINEAITFVLENGKVKGRERIYSLHLDNNSTIKRIVKLYQ